MLGFVRKIGRTMFPLRVNIDDSIVIVDASAGGSHVCAVDSSGRVFSWGNNDSMQCGYESVGGSDPLISKPTIIPNLSGITSVACGSAHTVCLTQNGGVVVFGDNRDGQLGLYTQIVISKPTLLTLPCRIKQVCAGGRYSLLLGEDGNVYMSGTFNDEVHYSFTVVLSDVEGGIQQIYAGGNSCAAVSGLNKLYMWGEHVFGSDEPFVYSPQLIQNDMNFQLITMGVSHTCLLNTCDAISDLRPPSNLTWEESAILADWYPQRLINRYRESQNSLKVMDVVLVLLSFVSQSNHNLFAQQYTYSHSHTTPNLSGCFQMTVTNNSIRGNLDMIKILVKLYYSLYQKNREKSGEPHEGEVLQDNGSMDDKTRTLDIDMDIDELMRMSFDESQMISHEKRTTQRSHAINPQFEDKQCCCLLYRSIELLYSQLLYLVHTDRFSASMMQIDTVESVPLLSELYLLLGIDSDSNEMSLVKKSVAEVISTLSLFCTNYEQLSFVYKGIFKEYELAKKDPKVDHYVLLDTIFGLLQLIESQQLWGSYLDVNDMTHSLDALTDFLTLLYNNLSGELEAYVRYLVSENRKVDMSGITNCALFILRTILSFYNTSFQIIKAGRNEGYDLKQIVMVLSKLAQSTIGFTSKLLTCFVEAIMWKDNVSEELAFFIKSSPAYKAVEYLLTVYYSILNRSYAQENNRIKIKVNLDMVYQSILVEVHYLLEPLSNYIITLDRCIDFLKNKNSTTIGTI